MGKIIPEMGVVDEGSGEAEVNMKKKITPITHILVLVTLLGCQSISSSCCIISKNTKSNTG